jgi:hypothetical protein
LKHIGTEEAEESRNQEIGRLRISDSTRQLPNLWCGFQFWQSWQFRRFWQLNPPLPPFLRVSRVYCAAE